MPGLLDNRQALGAGLLSAGGAMMQGGQRGLLGSLGQGLQGFAQGRQGFLDQQRQNQLYDLQLAGLQRQERQDALSEEQRQQMAQSVESYLQQNDFPPEVDGLVRARMAGGDQDGALQIATDYVTKQMEGADAPTIKDFLAGGMTVQKQWNPATNTWDEVGSGPRFAPTQPPAPRAPVQAFNPKTGMMEWTDPGAAVGMPSKAPGEDGGGESGFKNENTLRDEFVALTKPVREAQVALEKVRSAAKLDTGAGDVALVFGFMKTIDPGSTVREGEFATAEQTAGIPGQITATYNKILSGQRLTPEQRQQFVDAAEQQFAVYQNQYDSLAASYSGIAKKYMIDPSKILVPLGPAGGQATAESDPNYDPLGILR